MIANLLLSFVLLQTNSAELENAMAVLDKLEHTSLTIDFRDEPLKTVIDDLNGRMPVPLRADWEALARLGIHAGDRVTLRSNPTSAMTVLSGLALALGSEYERPLCEEHAGQMVLTTLAGTAPMRVTGVYDVRDLLRNTALLQQLRDQLPRLSNDVTKEPSDQQTSEDTPPNPASPQAAPPEAPLAVPAEDYPHGQVLPGLKGIDAALIDQPRRPPTPGEQLVMLITDHVDPDAWINFGGDRALISDLDGVLVVTATPTTHRRFREALASLRSANPNTLAVDAAIVELNRGDLERLKRQSPPNSGAYLANLRNDPAAKLVWSASTAVADGAKLDIESAAGSAQVHVVLSPRRNADSGMLDIELEASTREADDLRSLKTTVALTPDQAGAAVELPGGKASEMTRWLVLAVKR